MSATLSQLDQANLKKRINSSAPITLRQRVQACLLLFELYESHLNLRVINKFIKAHGGRNSVGPVKVLYDKLLEKRILKNREKIRAKKQAAKSNASVVPLGAVAIAPDENGVMFYVDVSGNILGKAPAEETNAS